MHIAALCLSSICSYKYTLLVKIHLFIPGCHAPTIDNGAMYGSIALVTFGSAAVSMTRLLKQSFCYCAVIITNNTYW